MKSDTFNKYNFQSSHLRHLRRPPPRIRQPTNLPSPTDLVHDKQVHADMVQPAVDLGLERRPHHGQVAALADAHVRVPDALLQVLLQGRDAVDVRVERHEAQRHHGRAAQRHPARGEAAFLEVGAGFGVQGAQEGVCYGEDGADVVCCRRRRW